MRDHLPQLNPLGFFPLNIELATISGPLVATSFSSFPPIFNCSPLICLSRNEQGRLTEAKSSCVIHHRPKELSFLSLDRFTKKKKPAERKTRRGETKRSLKSLRRLGPSFGTRGGSLSVYLCLYKYTPLDTHAEPHSCDSRVFINSQSKKKRH